MDITYLILLVALLGIVGIFSYIRRNLKKGKVLMGGGYAAMVLSCLTVFLLQIYSNEPKEFVNLLSNFCLVFGASVGSSLFVQGILITPPGSEQQT